MRLASLYAMNVPHLLVWSSTEGRVGRLGVHPWATAARLSPELHKAAPPSGQNTGITTTSEMRGRLLQVSCFGCVDGSLLKRVAPADGLLVSTIDLGKYSTIASYRPVL